MALVKGLVYTPTKFISGLPMLLGIVVSYFTGHPLRNNIMLQVIYVGWMAVTYYARNMLHPRHAARTHLGILYYIGVAASYLYYLRHHLALLGLVVLPVVVVAVVWSLYLVFTLFDKLPIDKTAYTNYINKLIRHD